MKAKVYAKYLNHIGILCVYFFIFTHFIYHLTDNKIFSNRDSDYPSYPCRSSVGVKPYRSRKSRAKEDVELYPHSIITS